jgi:hypothetical protein
MDKGGGHTAVLISFVVEIGSDLHDIKCYL